MLDIGWGDTAVTMSRLRERCWSSGWCVTQHVFSSLMNMLAQITISVQLGVCDLSGHKTVGHVAAGGSAAWGAAFVSSWNLSLAHMKEAHNIFNHSVLFLSFTLFLHLPCLLCCSLLSSCLPPPHTHTPHQPLITLSAFSQFISVKPRLQAKLCDGVWRNQAAAQSCSGHRPWGGGMREFPQ